VLDIPREGAPFNSRVSEVFVPVHGIELCHPETATSCAPRLRGFGRVEAEGTVPLRPTLQPIH